MAKKKKVKRGMKSSQVSRVAKLDAAYRKKYPHYVGGSIEPPSNGIPKWSAEIECTEKGCKETRQVYTSDLFQVKVCHAHKKRGGKKAGSKGKAKAKGKPVKKGSKAKAVKAGPRPISSFTG